MTAEQKLSMLKEHDRHADDWAAAPPAQRQESPLAGCHPSNRGSFRDCDGTDHGGL